MEERTVLCFIQKHNYQTFLEAMFGVQVQQTELGKQSLTTILCDLAQLL